MKYLVSLLALVFLVSCGPSINPEYQKQINNVFAKGKGGSFSASGKFLKPMPMAVGQWITTGSTYKGKKTIERTSIIGQEQGGWIYDFYSLSETEETATQMLIKGFDTYSKPEDADKIEIVWVKMKDENGDIQKIEGPMLQLMSGMFKKTMNNLFVNVDAILDGGTITVPAGTFPGCSKVSGEVSVLGTTYKSTAWHHPDVPISGMIKSVSDDNTSVTELIDFGITGAKKSF